MCAVSACTSSRACWHSVVVGRVEGAAPDHVREDDDRRDAPVVKERIRGRCERYWLPTCLLQVPLRTSRYRSRRQTHMCNCLFGCSCLKIRHSHVLQACVKRIRPVTTASDAGSARACAPATAPTAGFWLQGNLRQWLLFFCIVRDREIRGNRTAASCGTIVCQSYPASDNAPCRHGRVGCDTRGHAQMRDRIAILRHVAGAVFG